MPPVAQAAIAHARFETIHPFIDGNGRVGRCPAHLILPRASQRDRIDHANVACITDVLGEDRSVIEIRSNR